MQLVSKSSRVSHAFRLEVVSLGRLDLLAITCADDGSTRRDGTQESTSQRLGVVKSCVYYCDPRGSNGPAQPLTYPVSSRLGFG